jgi:hypothetical protein
MINNTPLTYESIKKSSATTNEVSAENKEAKVEEEIEKITTKETFLKAINENNLFLLIGSGSSPVKYSTSSNKEALSYKKGSSFSISEATIDNKKYKPLILDDIYYQASTRGGREIDNIINGKVNFKDNTKKVGETLQGAGAVGLYAGLAMSNNSNSDAGAAVALIGLTTILVGAVATSISDAVKAQADTRSWNNLPGEIYLITAKLDSGTHNILVADKNISIDINPAETVIIISLLNIKT